MAPLKHAILGVGGVGGTLGTLLAHLGGSVSAVVRPNSLANYPEQFHLESAFGNFDVLVSRAAEVPACDVLWISVKATQLDAALRAITNPEKIGAIVPLLNGVDHLSLLRAKYGSDRVIAGTIAGEMERVARGRFVHRTPFLRLNLSSAGRGLLGITLDGLTKIGLECRFIDDEATLMWSKLVFLAPIALATTAADQSVGGIMSDPQWRQQWESCVREACAVATAEGAKVDAEAVLTAVPKMPGAMRSSMQKDVEQGNPPELAAIAGPIIRLGNARGIDVVATERLAEAVAERTRHAPMKSRP
jgi:2-dehydropantoate 2-reductase